MLEGSLAKKVSASADIHVFVCANPWPAVDADGNWRPWQDNPDASTCIAGSGACGQMNYELYYCRDQAGTADPLPLVNGRTTRGSGSSATTGILKESYFFKQ